MTATQVQRYLPNFMIIGASKCGTTSLWTYLNRHPEVFLTDPKEPMYFSCDAHYEQGVDWYSKLFENAAGKQAIGEATTSYTYAPHSPDVPERMHRLLPDCKLIYMVRPPVERTYSHYLQELQVRVWAPEGELGSFETALKKCPLLIDAGMYQNQIDNFLRYFSRDQIKILLLEDLKWNPDSVLRDVLTFLELPWVDLKADKTVKANSQGDHHVRSELNRRLNDLKAVPGVKLLSRAVPKSFRTKMYHGMTSSKAIRKMASLELEVDPARPETTEYLRDLFREPTLQFGDFISRDLSHWC